MSDSKNKKSWDGHYRIVSDEPDCLLIRATGPWGVSTNWKDGTPEIAEEVGARLKPGQRLEFLNFRATRREQLVLKDGKFIGFARAGVSVDVNALFTRKPGEIIAGKQYRVVPLHGITKEEVGSFAVHEFPGAEAKDGSFAVEQTVEAECSAKEIAPGVWDTIYVEGNLSDREYYTRCYARPDLFQGPVDEPIALPPNEV